MNRLLTYLILIILASAAVGCGGFEERDVELCLFDNLELKECYNINLKIAVNENNVVYEYFDSTENKEYKPTIDRLTTTDSIILCDYWDCPITDYRDYIIENKSYRVNKYFYDEEFSVDEEYEFYFSDTVGLLISTGGFWGGHATYSSNRLSDLLINSIKQDSTGFWLLNVY